MVKYLGKTFTTDSPTGRVWGVWGKFEKAECSTHTGVDWYQLLRRVRKWGKKSGYLRNINGLLLKYGIRRNTVSLPAHVSEHIVACCLGNGP